MNTLFIAFSATYTATWITGFYMSKKSKTKELKTIHLGLSLVT